MEEAEAIWRRNVETRMVIAFNYDVFLQSQSGRV